MNDLLATGRVGEYVDLKKDAERDLEMGHKSACKQKQQGGSVQAMDLFLEEVDVVKKEMEKVRELLRRLQSSHEESKKVHKAESMKVLREKMDEDVGEVLRKVREIKGKLEELDRGNHGYGGGGGGGGTTLERTRCAVTGSLRKKLKGLMEEFQGLREKVRKEHREAVERRLYMVTGKKAEEETVERMIETGESEGILQKAIVEQGKGQIVEVVMEMQERHDAAKEMERSLLELHQIFMDMAVMVESQGERLDDIELHVQAGHAYVERAAADLRLAKQNQRSSRRCAFIAIIIFLILVVLILAPVLTSFKNS